MVNVQFIIETKLKKLSRHFGYEPDSEQEFETQKVMIELWETLKSEIKKTATGLMVPEISLNLDGVDAEDYKKIMLEYRYRKARNEAIKEVISSLDK